MAFCLAPEVSKAQPSLLLALSAQGNKPLTTRSKRDCCWTAGPCFWGGVGGKTWFPGHEILPSQAQPERGLRAWLEPPIVTWVHQPHFY